MEDIKLYWLLDTWVSFRNNCNFKQYYVWLFLQDYFFTKKPMPLKVTGIGFCYNFSWDKLCLERREGCSYFCFQIGPLLFEYIIIFTTSSTTQLFKNAPYFQQLNVNQAKSLGFHGRSHKQKPVSCTFSKESGLQSLIFSIL